MPASGMVAVGASGRSALPASTSKTDLPRRWLRADDAASYLGISHHHLAKLREHGRGPAYRKLGRVVVYDLRDLDAFAERLPRRAG